ncbi:MAG: beta-phosphoglucomutase [Bacteroides sp. SM1_62]|nr:MAG: beta-phosphoglucomutase [Bacteroides sp. SM1_62]
MTKHRFSAVIFDLDGVITQTALVHSTAWKEMFDTYLKFREEKYGEPFKEFSHTDDYLPYVDGKPRYKGVASFLESRGIDIPFGDPSDLPEAETVCGLGNRKNLTFNEILDRDGVKLYDSTVELIHDLKKEGIRIGVASSSKNCKTVLEAAGMLELFETRVDGAVSAELGLQGKPEPDIFTTACDNLGVEYAASVVVEDAVSGVQAGRKGNFGLVLGVAREENSHELLVNGADIAVDDIAELGGIEGIDRWFENGLEQDRWSIVYHDYDPEKEKSREALLAVGNGYFGTRGAMEETSAGKVNYPGTYMAGMFNRRISKVADRDIENEDFVNCPNWLPVSFRIGEGAWMDPNRFRVVQIQRRLSFRDGLLFREMIVEDEGWRQTKITSYRVASMEDQHVAVLKYTVQPLNYVGRISIRAELDGDLINDGVARYRQLDQHHLEPVEEGGDGQVQYLLVKTNQSGVEIGLACRMRILIDQAEQEVGMKHHTSRGKVASELVAELAEGQALTVEKLVSIYTSRESGEGMALRQAREKLDQLDGFRQVHAGSAGVWNEIWKKADIQVEGDRFAQKLLRMHAYHLMVTTSEHNKKLDAGIPARGLHGEAYRGHIFWDELYILNFYALHFPDIVKSVLMYRYRRIGEARKYAKEYGYEGAMYPWQSGSDGREETQIVHLNPVSGEWGDDYSSLQRHVSLAIAYNIWNYYWITMDDTFMAAEGGEMLLEICRFWASKAIWDEETERYSIPKVMGPDEFHEHLPGADEGGLKDNAYTNLMVAWLFGKVTAYLESVPGEKMGPILKKINLSGEEIDRWKDIKSRLTLHISEEGIIAQFDAYFGLQELDWDHYLEKYGNIHRMDRILKAEGKSPDDYKVAKQADTLMAWYNLGTDEVASLLSGLGYEADRATLRPNFNYYIQRTSHGSTLSRIVHASLANELGLGDLAWEFYMEALSSDYVDIQGGTTAEGIHAGVMGSTLLFVIQSIAGIQFRDEVLSVNPALPAGWKKISFNFAFRKKYYTFDVFREKMTISVDAPDDQLVEIKISGRIHGLVPGRKLDVAY